MVLLAIGFLPRPPGIALDRSTTASVLPVDRRGAGGQTSAARRGGGCAIESAPRWMLDVGMPTRRSPALLQPPRRPDCSGATGGYS
eukprot:scaffold107_cov106-Isochrysis_galbana.AAC.2